MHLLSWLNSRRRPREPDRRVWVRLPCDLKAACFPLGNHTDHRWHARVRDISRAGFRLSVDHPVEMGTFLSVELADTTVLALVVRVAKHAEGWDLACSFIAELDDGDLKELGARREKPDTDRRGWRRFASSFEILYQVVEATPSVWRTAYGVDIAAAGIGLQVAQALPLGTLLRLELPCGVILASVVRLSGMTESGGRLGCSFVRTLHEEELAALLDS